MHKRPQQQTPRRLRAAKWMAASVATLALLGCPDEDLAPLAPCTVSGVSDDVPVTGVDKVDLLFMIDNSGSMAQEQAKLAEQLPKLVRILTTGENDKNGDGKIDDDETFTPARDLHIGVVTSDMGLSGSKIELPPSCGGDRGRAGKGFGDDGLLVKSNKGCSAKVNAGYLNFVPDKLPESQRQGELEDTIEKFTCLAKVGTDGCGFEQQLEAVYKAVAPKAVKDFAGGTSGHGNGANDGFLRPEAVLAIIHVSDEEDCSVTDKGMVMFDDTSNAPGVLLPGSDSKRLGLNIRCAYMQKPGARKTQAEENGYVYDTDRYVTDFKKNVKPLNPERIVFAAIVGIPEDMEDASFEDMLDDGRMDFAVDPQTGNGDPTNRNAAARDVCRRCATKNEAECFAESLTIDGVSNPEIITGAKPAVRFVKVAQGFGENGLVKSICAESYAPAVDTIIDKISKQLTGACLPRALNPNSDGIVECDVVEVLGPSGTPKDCDSGRGRVFKEMRKVDGEQRVVCAINQVAVKGEKLEANPTPLAGVSKGDVGWYYDTFSDKLTKECPADRQRRISFTQGADPKDATVRFECFQPVVSSNTEVLGKEAVNSPCEDDNDCDGREDGFFNLVCDEGVKTCQIGCGQDSECPSSWVCNTEVMKCVNPTCPPPSLR